MNRKNEKAARIRSVSFASLVALLTALALTFSAAVSAANANVISYPDEGPGYTSEADGPVKSSSGSDAVSSRSDITTNVTDNTTPSATGTTTTAAGPTAGLENRISRLGGKTRIETAIATAQRGWAEGSGYALLANAFSYADALAGVPLAGELGAPILLTGGKTLETGVLSQLYTMNTNTVYILGGTAAVSEEVENKLRSLGVRTIRLNGDTRFSTAVSISSEYEKLSGKKPKNVFIASSANYPDALSAGAAASGTGGVLVYCAPDGQLDEDTANYLIDKKSSGIYVLGGEKAIAPGIASKVKLICGNDIERVSGADRYATALAVCKRFGEAFDGRDTVLATGESFPDALSGGALAAKLRSPVVLANNIGFTEEVYHYLRDRSPDTVYVMGGESALSEYAVKCLLTNTKITTKATQPPTGKVAYLTFDDGPSGNTPKILDILDRYNAKATFFVIYSPNYENEYKEIIKRGHTLALHSYTHEYSKIYRSDTAFWDDYKKLSDYIVKVTGYKPNIMRFPGGASNTVSRKYCRGIMTTLTKQTKEKGYLYYDWSVDSGDASGNKVAASKLINNVKNNVGSQKYPVILMHDAAAKTTTVDALPDIIKALKNKGYELCRIDESTPECHQRVAN